jgi:O-antigen ligase
VRKLTRVLFFTALFCATFENVHWNVAGTVYLADLTAAAFLVSFAVCWLAEGERRIPAASAALTAFLGVFLLVYLIGFFNLETRQALDQFSKGIVKFIVHFLFLIVGVIYLSRHSRRFFWRSLGWFTAGIAFNAAYGILQLLAAEAGHNLDAAVVTPLTGGAGAKAINLYGAVNGSFVYRPNALTTDPNHLGIMLLIPLLVLTPLYLRLERGHRWRPVLALLIPFLLVVELATLSRSGMLGLIVGFLILLLPYRKMLVSRALIVPTAIVLLPVAYVVWERRHFFSVVLRTRLERSGKGTSAHFGVYDFIPDVLHQHPLFGLGYNNFSVYYEFVTGKTNWGPHSYFVALLVEGGVVGAAVFVVFLWYVFRRLGAARRLGRSLVAMRDPLARRVRPLGWGMTAALAGTIAANAFYLTMSFAYFFAFVIFAVAVPTVFARRV